MTLLVSASGTGSIGGGAEVANVSTPLTAGRAPAINILTDPAGETAACDGAGDARPAGDAGDARPAGGVRAKGDLAAFGTGLLDRKFSISS